MLVSVKVACNGADQLQATDTTLFPCFCKKVLHHLLANHMTNPQGPLDQEAASWGQLANRCNSHQLQLQALQFWVQHPPHAQLPESDLELIIDLISSPELHHILVPLSHSGHTSEDGGVSSATGEEAESHFHAALPRVQHMQQQLTWRVQRLLRRGQPKAV